MDNFFRIIVEENEAGDGVDVRVQVSKSMTSEKMARMAQLVNRKFIDKLVAQALINLINKEADEFLCNKLVNRRGSVDDIRASLKVTVFSSIELKLALDDELKNQNRSSVVQLLEAAIKRKMREEVKNG